jgi:hypothetical protein
MDEEPALAVSRPEGDRWLVLEREVSRTGLIETEQPFRSGEMDSQACREMKKRLSQLSYKLRAVRGAPMVHLLRDSRSFVRAR